MSNEKVESAKLSGFNGPFFPRELDRIQKRFAYHAERFNEQFYAMVRERMGRGARIKHYAQTSDIERQVLSPWPFGISFPLHGKHYKILFPSALDSDRNDGTYATRHVALYVREEATEEELAKAAKYAAHVFTNAYRVKYKRAILQSKHENRANS